MMTDEELKDLVGGLAVAQAETDRLLKELAAEADRRQAEADRRQVEADRRQAEADRRHQETERLLEELAKKADRRRAEVDRSQKAMQKEIGGLANKFGGFTEGLALPSMEKLLTERFGMEFVAPNIRKRRGGRWFEVDVLAYSNTHSNVVFIVEVKSRLKEESIEQMLRNLEEFFNFFPEHRGKKLYGILAVVEAGDTLRGKVLENGIYLARISGDVFQLEVPDDFEPRCFQQPLT